MTLGIESSCDESALALISPETVQIHGGSVANQISLHTEYGCVVPDLVMRAHLDSFPALLKNMAAKLPDWQQGVATIAVTTGPGLAGCLATGIACAQAIRMVQPRIALVGVNHPLGHAFSPFIPIWSEHAEAFHSTLDRLLPHLGLIVSGGNTALVRIDRDHTIITLGETVDDAAGRGPRQRRETPWYALFRRTAHRTHHLKRRPRLASLPGCRRSPQRPPLLLLRTQNKLEISTRENGRRDPRPKLAPSLRQLSSSSSSAKHAISGRALALFKV